jgi:DNA-binding transcriptional MerR regulator
MVERASEGAGGGSSPAEKRYYRIGEVSRLTAIKPYVLRYWESEFRWMAPQKSRSKQRLYRQRDVEIILLIKKLLYEQRYTIAGARQKLREMGVGRALEEGTLVL